MDPTEPYSIPRQGEETNTLSRQENNPVTEITSAQSNQEGAVQSQEPNTTRKPFVEPAVSVPLDVLEATAFFQGSAALDTADV